MFSSLWRFRVSRTWSRWCTKLSPMPGQSADFSLALRSVLLLMLQKSVQSRMAVSQTAVNTNNTNTAQKRPQRIASAVVLPSELNGGEVARHFHTFLLFYHSFDKEKRNRLLGFWKGMMRCDFLKYLPLSPLTYFNLPPSDSPVTSLKPRLAQGKVQSMTSLY